MLIRVEQGKGRKDRNAMLSPQLLALLRFWWREAKRRGVMLPQGWLFPGRRATDPISARQINRAAHEAAEDAEIRKRVAPYIAPQLRHPSAGTGCRHPCHPGAVGARQLDPAALYARVATKTIRSVTSPLERLALLMQGGDPGG